MLCDECQNKINDYREEKKDILNSLPKQVEMSFEQNDKIMETGNSSVPSLLDTSFKLDYMRSQSESLETDSNLFAQSSSL